MNVETKVLKRFVIYMAILTFVMFTVWGFVKSFMKIVPKTEDIRTNHILGMGTYQFGRGKATHYVLHTFTSYSDLKNSLDAYMQKGVMAEHFNQIKDISTPAGNSVTKIIKQW